MDMNGAKGQPPAAMAAFKRRLLGFAAVGLTLFIILGVRLAYLQIDRHAYYARIAAHETAQAQPVPPHETENLSTAGTCEGTNPEESSAC